jgi:uroporphyrinogen-III decarboxylase
MMRQETMTRPERIWAAIGLEKPDRVPIMPLINVPSAARLMGLNMAELYADADKAFDAMLGAFDEFGGWDAGTGYPLMPVRFNVGGLKVKIPGRELPDDYELQMVEEEVITPEDYDAIADMGWATFATENAVFRRVSDMTQEDVDRDMAKADALAQRAEAEWRKRDALLFLLNIPGGHPFFHLSLARSMTKFTEDLYYTPEKVERVLETMVAETIEVRLKRAKEVGVKAILVVEERAGGFFYPLHIFERFWWPHTVQMVDAFWSEGIVTFFHLDTSWDKNLPYFKQLPRGSAIIDLDGTTDIFAAKELLRDHLCISTDVPPSLLALGKPEEVEAYCKRLIDEVGGDGGMILASGCEVPPTVKRENFEAMINTGRTYELSKE